MTKEGCENLSALLILFIFYLKKKEKDLHKANLALDNKTLKWGEISFLKRKYEINVFFSNTRCTQLLPPLEIILSQIYL